jgi:hypothetical protein
VGGLKLNYAPMKLKDGHCKTPRPRSSRHVWGGLMLPQYNVRNLGKIGFDVHRVEAKTVTIHET